MSTRSKRPTSLSSSPNAATAAVLVSYEEFEGLQATRDEMSYADWPRRLARAERETRKGQGRTLESYLNDRKP